MKGLRLIFLLPVLLHFGCDLRVREQKLEKRIDSINQKERQLLVLDNQLDFKSRELEAREHILDSLLKRYVPQDSVQPKQLFLVGRWTVKMVCTETTCPGSAVGDNKTEVWDISYQNNMVVAQALVNNKLVRLYTGTASDSELLLTAQQDTASQGTNITANLLYKSQTEMEGQRKIVRPDECRIVYSIQMDKIVIP